MNLRNTLSAGRTEITFTATSPATKNTVSCSLVVTVADQESPKVNGCPDNIQVKVAQGDRGQVVYWREPQFFDNIDVVQVYKSKVNSANCCFLK